MRARSATCVRGLAIVSTNTRRVAGVSARSTLATSVASTNVMSVPCAASVPNRLTVLPNRNWLVDDVIAFAQQRQHRAPIAAMPVAKQTVRHAVLHLRHLRLERRGRRVALPAVRVALRAALEDRGEIARVAVAVRDGEVQRLVQRAVLDAGVAVGMEDRGRESPRGLSVLMETSTTKNPFDVRRTGLVACARKCIGSRPNLALAVFIKRPQAEAQIGAVRSLAVTGRRCQWSARHPSSSDIRRLSASL